MSCEHHCAKCRREEVARYHFAREQALRAEPVEFKQESRFVWWPVRDPKSKQTHWLRYTTFYYETRVFYPPMSSRAIRQFKLVEIKQGR